MNNNYNQFTCKVLAINGILNGIKYVISRMYYIFLRKIIDIIIMLATFINLDPTSSSKYSESL